ncbi:hypothetical protein [Leptolyngbya sp. 7M]|uniref:hypothetical protein n=1 Tax=Leptolyngbya sp. 7M TaxID=2812896 RepID=UPI001B8BD070|nr:hypothetical protein [Leptolyngbya sp. 7M]QYO62044.1 hypothetical protein JVX88_18135 [Leptolyngbya sp. 7M]
MSNADNKLRGAKNLGVLSSPISRTNKVGLTDQDDLYRVSLKQRSRLDLTLTKPGKGRCAVELYALKRPLAQVLRQIGKLDFRKIGRKERNANLKLIPAAKQGRSQKPGIYFVRVLHQAGNSRYRLQVAAPPVDTANPTASLSATNLSVGGNSSYDFTVTYSDDVAVNVNSLTNNNILVTSTNGFNQLASRVSISNTGNGTPRSVTYRITAPGGSWDSADNGSYSITLQANQVSDTSGKFVAPGVLGNFQVNISQTPVSDQEAPTANLLSVDSNTRDLTVVYRDNLTINAASIDDSDLQVISPNGAQLVTRVIANDSSNSTTRTVIYRITPPGGSWDNADNGSYSIALQANQINDTSSNFAAAKQLGTFEVNIPPRIGNQYSITGTDETNISAQFKLFSTAPDGNPISDQAGSNLTGLFTGAIGNFASGSGRLESINSSNLVVPFQSDNKVSYESLNLRAELLNYDPFAQTGTLEYRFFQEPVNEFQPGIDKTIFGLRFTITANFVQNFDLNLAVNSLEYIVQNNLLGDGSNSNKLSGIGFSDDPIWQGKDIAGGSVLTPVPITASTNLVAKGQ